MTAVAVPLWAGQAIVVGVAVAWIALFVVAWSLCRAAAIGDRQTIDFPSGPAAAAAGSERVAAAMAARAQAGKGPHHDEQHPTGRPPRPVGFIGLSPHDARDDVAPHPESGAGTPSPVPGPRGPWSPNKGGEG